MTREEAKRVIEVLLFVNDRPLPQDRIAEVLEGEVEKGALKSIIDELNDDYARTNRAFSIAEVAEGFQILTDPFYAPWIRKLYTKEKRQRLTTPSLEALSIIAYRQPITRPEIEAIRGVNTEGVLDSLMARGLIRITGRKDVPGKPFLYGTTKEFLVHFGLSSLDALPKLRDFKLEDIQLGREELIKKENEITNDEAEDKSRSISERMQEDLTGQGDLTG